MPTPESIQNISPQDLSTAQTLREEFMKLREELKEAVRENKKERAKKILEQGKLLTNRILSLERGDGDILQTPDLSTTYTTPEGTIENITLNIEQQITRFQSFYTKEQIDIPPNFEEEIRKIWNDNYDKIKQIIEAEGYDDVLLIPPHDLSDIHTKLTSTYNATFQGDNFRNAGSFQTVTDTKPNQIRIVLIHKNKAQNLERPELNQNKNKNIYQLCGLAVDSNGNPTDSSEKQNIDNLITNKQPLPVEGLTLGEYLIADRIFFLETGQHLDESTWTWLPNSYLGDRVVHSGWDSGGSRMYVDAFDSNCRSSDGGCRSSRTIL